MEVVLVILLIIGALVLFPRTIFKLVIGAAVALWAIIGVLAIAALLALVAFMIPNGAAAQVALIVCGVCCGIWGLQYYIYEKHRVKRNSQKYSIKYK